MCACSLESQMAFFTGCMAQYCQVRGPCATAVHYGECLWAH